MKTITTLNLLFFILLLNTNVSTHAQVRKWEIGFGADIYKCQMTDIGNSIFLAYDNGAIKNIGESRFNRSETTTPVGYSLYVRTPISKKNNRLWMQAGFGLWQHTSEVHFDTRIEWPYSTPDGPLSIKVQYWHIPLSIQYHQKIVENLTAVFSAGVNINWQRMGYDYYESMLNKEYYSGGDAENSYSSRLFLSPRLSAALQYNLKRHLISVTPFVQFGNSLVQSGNSNSIDNFERAKWKTPYGIGLQYYYRLF